MRSTMLSSKKSKPKKGASGIPSDSKSKNQKSSKGPRHLRSNSNSKMTNNDKRNGKKGKGGTLRDFLNKVPKKTAGTVEDPSKERTVNERTVNPSLMMKSTVKADLNVSKMSKISKVEMSREWPLIQKFVEHVFSKNVIGLVDEFRKCERPTKVDEVRCSEFVRQNGAKPPRNRYKDVSCLDISRIILRGNQSYIHANFVGTPKHACRFICTQGPMDSTTVDFWRMVVENESKVIIMLCNFVERNSNKCATYFPMQNSSATFGEYVVECTDVGMIWPSGKSGKKGLVQIRTSNLTVYVNGNAVHHCTHFHWIDWPDRGVPEDVKAPIGLLKLVSKITDKMIIVHCSAGVGRTGVIVLLQYMLDMIEMNKEISGCRQPMIKVREYRHNSVQTEQQYLYVHQVLLSYFQENKWLPKECNKQLQKFTAEYNSEIKGFEK